MKILTFSALAAAVSASMLAGMPAQAQERVWRCGNEYTNNAADAQRRNCKLMEGGNVTVVQGASAAARSAASASASGGSGAARAPAGSPRVESAEQRQRDSDARAVLEAELQKAQARQAELQREYNNGEPEKQGGEAKNYQKYLDRVADMKAQIARNESDIAGLQREISRLPQR
ncbi:hypothetical protein PGB34_09310 [Xenophilus arseniciresistens]|uniref:Uncharacterized protein n=1 Tax=Xenophilus arseniciresistens TaxID=1283306 RepID=A0AAE3N7I5_9BURK|nr:hypothetical protein [Xenophilus arseniciresistens]MDA7416566.1 hypothetical protein [Xenophilus arseniciresistens]